jgi:hypothetical protein
MTTKISPTQQVVIDRMREADGRIFRLPGGFWTVSTATVKDGVPDWWCGTQTVWAMEKRGLLQRTNKFPEAWRDDRMLSPENTEPQ